MTKKRLGKTNLMVTAVGMGTYPMRLLRKKEGVELIKKVLALGVNFIDTGNIYDDSEEKIGEAVKESRREDLIIASKSLARDKKSFLEHVDLSLKRMAIDYIDIYYLHHVSSEKETSTSHGTGRSLRGTPRSDRKG